MSQEIIIRTDNSKYASMIIELAKKLGLKMIIKTKTAEKNIESISDNEKIIYEGGDMSYVNDPVEWQRKIRKDRNIF